MPREVPEWIGRDDNEPVPLRVKIRVWEKYGRRCGQERCGHRDIRVGDKWCCDHIKALVNGGENREANLQPLCSWCRPDKDKHDVAIKSETYATITSHYGQKQPKGQPIPGSKRSKFKRKMNGTVELRK